MRILMRGGYVHTPPSAGTAPHPSAVCVDGGEVVWVGDDDASAHFLDGADRVIELEGRLVTPAFVDAHVHLSQTGIVGASVDLSRSRSLVEALDDLADHARTSILPVVLGANWDDTRWPEQRPFTRAEVDLAVDGKVAHLARVDGHSAVVSSAFLDRMPELVGTEGYSTAGWLTREANIRARDAVFELVPASAQEEAIARALESAARHGIGMVHENGAPGDSPAEDFARIRAVRAGTILPEVVGYWGRLDAVEEARRLGCAGAAGDLCMDGAVGSRTAAMGSPYADAPDGSGHLYLTADEVARHVVSCTEAGLQAGFHVIGDRATDELVEGLRLAVEKVGVPAMVRARHRLEHLEMVSPEQMSFLAELGVTASVQPRFDALWGGAGSMYAQRLGPERALAMNPYASLARAGVMLALGSDTPVTPFDPWGAVRAAAWHHNEQERVTVRAAFNAHTRGGWRAACRDEGGAIVPGAPAGLAVWDVPGDLVVQTPDVRVAAWSTDPRAGVPHLPDLHPDQPLPTCVLTLVGGEIAFEEVEHFVKKLDLDPAAVRKARSLARQAGRPIVNLAKQHTTVSVERATLRLAGLQGADPDGIPWVNRLLDAVRGDVGIEHGVAAPVWDALVRGEGDDLATLAQKASAGSIRFRVPEGRDLTRAKSAARKQVGAGVRRVDARRRERDRLVKRWGDPERKPWVYLIVATGDIYEDMPQAQQAAREGADVIAVIRSTGQSLLDYVPEGPTREGFAGTYATQENFRLMRAALDESSKELGRYVRLTNYASGLCMPEIASLAGLERLDMMLNDSMYGILFRDINPVRTFVDQRFSRQVHARAGIIINTGEDNYLTTADAVEAAHTVTVSQLLNEYFAKEAGLEDWQLGLGHAFEIDPDLPDSFRMELAHAMLARELFPKAPLKWMPPTRHMTGDVFRGYMLDAFFNLVGSLSGQDILLVGMMTEAVVTPWLSDRDLALQNVRYVMNAAGNLHEDFRPAPDGFIVQRARQVLAEGIDLLERIVAHEGRHGLLEAIGDGTFGLMRRPADAGRGLDGVAMKAPGYYNPASEILEAT